MREGDGYDQVREGVLTVLVHGARDVRRMACDLVHGTRVL